MAAPRRSALNARVGEVTERIVRRSHDARSRYLDRLVGKYR